VHGKKLIVIGNSENGKIKISENLFSVFGQCSESKPCGWCLDIISGFQNTVLEFAHNDAFETLSWIFETPLLYSLQVAAELSLENGVY
jgi:hypothetical protein